jgi:hypothetical protein
MIWDFMSQVLEERERNLHAFVISSMIEHCA